MSTLDRAQAGPEAFSGLGLSPEAREAVSSLLDPAERSPRTVRSAGGGSPAFRGLADAVRHELEAEAAAVVPALFASLFRAALGPDARPGTPPSALALEAADARDRLNDAALRARSSFARRNLRPALLDLSEYLGRYDKTAAGGRMPGRPQDWDHVAAEVRWRLGVVARAARELGAEAPDGLTSDPRASRRSLEKLLGSAKDTLDGASAGVRRIALGPPPSAPEAVEKAWQEALEECAPALALAKGLSRRLQTEPAAQPEAA